MLVGDSIGHQMYLAFACHVLAALSARDDALFAPPPPPRADTNGSSVDGAAADDNDVPSASSTCERVAVRSLAWRKRFEVRRESSFELHSG